MIAVEEYVGKEVWCICLTKFEVYQAVVSGWDSMKKYAAITNSKDDLIDFVQPQRLFSDRITAEIACCVNLLKIFEKDNDSTNFDDNFYLLDLVDALEHFTIEYPDIVLKCYGV